MAMALAKFGVEFEAENPVSALMEDTKKGLFPAEILDEKVLSAILEFKIENRRLDHLLIAIKDIATRIDTVFSLGLINRVESDGSIPAELIAREAGFFPRPNMKTNVGLASPIEEG